MKNRCTRIAGNSIFLIVVMSSTIANAELKDPTRPLGYQSSGPISSIVEAIPDSTSTEGDISNWKLYSTLTAGSRSIAVINNQIVRKGDIIGELKVIEITPSQVLLRKNGENIVLSLISQSVKKPAVAFQKK